MGGGKCFKALHKSHSSPPASHIFIGKGDDTMNGTIERVELAPVRKRQRIAVKKLKRYRYLYLMIMPVLAYYIIFHYLPMVGVSIAFQDYRITRGIFESRWVGFKHFTSFFTSQYAWRTIRNTLSISIYSLVFAFPMPIMLALLLNEIKRLRFKKMVQTITYMPHFISSVVICSIILDFVSNGGIVNEILGLLGMNPINFMSQPNWFYPIYILSGIWQHVGWDSIIFLAAIASIDESLYEAASIDGAGRFKQIWHITLPGLLPTVAILLILRIGQLMNVGYEKILLLYNPSIYSSADVISTFVYRKGIADANYSYAAAIGLFNSIVNFILLVSTNKISKKLGQSGLW